MIGYEPDCVFCPSNDRVKIVAQSIGGYLIRVVGGELDDCYFIIPKSHITHVFSLPPTWQEDLNELGQQVPWFKGPQTSFNLSYNQGKTAGQRIEHVHAWVIPRDGESLNSPGYGLGPATVLARLNKR